MKNNFIGKGALLLFLLVGAVSAFANPEDVQTASEGGLLNWMLENVVLLMGVFVVLLAFAALLYLNHMLFQLEKMRLLQEHGIEVLEEVKLMSREPWWKHLSRKAWKIVPVEKEADIMFDHEYDGIRELDNSLPPWWLWLFYGTIAFSVIYVGYYHVLGLGLSSQEAYEEEMKRAEEQVKAYLATQADQVDENTVTALTDPQELALGESIFKANCAACHGQLGEGGVGPNLTDPYWIHGGDIKSIFRTIAHGVPEKGMIAWNTQLRPADIQRVASYILTLQGTNPPNAKEPEGELFQVKDETPAPDSLSKASMSMR